MIGLTREAEVFGGKPSRLVTRGSYATGGAFRGEFLPIKFAPCSQLLRCWAIVCWVASTIAFILLSRAARPSSRLGEGFPRPRIRWSQRWKRCDPKGTVQR